MADAVIAEGILAISELVNVPGEINVDLADVTRVLNIPGIAIMTTGWGEGGSGAEKAAEAVIFDPFLETHVNGAKGVLFNFSGGPDLTIGGVDRAASLVSKHVDPQAVVFFGMSLPKEEFRGKVRLTLVATGVKSPLNDNGRRSEVGESLRRAIPRVSLKFSKK